MLATKCEGVGCPLRESCYRYKAPAQPLYSVVFNGMPFERGVEGSVKCDYYVVAETPKRRSK